MPGASGLYDLHAPSLEGDDVDLARYAGTVALVVNVASECGYTPQYAGLQALHAELVERGFTVLGFPSNDFGGQEPGGPGEIRGFCTSRYAVDFPLFAKVETRPGPGQSPVYACLERLAGALPTWNFGKYVVSRDGLRARFFPSDVAPDSEVLRAAIEDALE